MTTRQEAITNAWNWAAVAEEHATAAANQSSYAHQLRTSGGDAIHREKITNEAAHQQASTDRATTMATMWARIATLLPTEPEPDEPAQADATERSGANESADTRCRSRHTTHDGDVRCDRQSGHHGMHSRPGYNWPNPSAKQLTEPAAASVVTVPGQRPTVEDGPTPRCQSRYQAADGVERCDREAGHPGVHQGVTVGWRTEQAILGSDYSATTEPRCPSEYYAAAAGALRCIRPTGHPGVHCDAGVQWYSGVRLPDERVAAPQAGLCCQQSVAHVAGLLLVHARTAPGLTAYERRCLEDAADFVRAHMPAAPPDSTTGLERRRENGDQP